MGKTSYGEPGVPLQDQKFAPEETFSWWVYQNQQPLIIPSLDAETRFPAVVEMLKNRGVRSVCALPLTTVHRRLGGLAVGSLEANAYSNEEVSFLSLVANQVALAVDDALNLDASLHAKEALRASQESFRLIVDSIPAFAWAASPDGKMEYLNQRILDFTAERQEKLNSPLSGGWIITAKLSKKGKVGRPLMSSIRTTSHARQPHGNGRSKLDSHSRKNTASAVPTVCIVGFRVAAFLCETVKAVLSAGTA